MKSSSLIFIKLIIRFELCTAHTEILIWEIIHVGLTWVRSQPKLCKTQKWLREFDLLLKPVNFFEDSHNFRWDLNKVTKRWVFLKLKCLCVQQLKNSWKNGKNGCINTIPDQLVWLEWYVGNIAKALFCS